MDTITICTTLSEEEFDREVAELDITRCSFCFVKLEKEIDVYGYKDFPLCQKCHLEGVQPDDVMIDLKKLARDMEEDEDHDEEVINRLISMRKVSEKTIAGLVDDIDWWNGEIFDLEEKVEKAEDDLHEERKRCKAIDLHIKRLQDEKS